MNERLLSKIRQVGDRLAHAPAGRVLLDPGVAFSGLHAIVFAGSPSPLIQGLGIASLALTASVSALRQLYPALNQKIAARLNFLFNAAKAPTIDSNGFPLFLNGIVLSGIALASFANGDYTSGAISLAYAIANTDKGARISQRLAWTMEGVCKSAFDSVAALPLTAHTIKTGLQSLSATPPRFLKHSLYLPELWGSLGAFVYGISHSGVMAIAGAGLATVAVAAAAINNGNPRQPAIQENPVLGKIASLSDRGETPASDQVISRRFMKYASLTYSAGAALLGHFGPAAGHLCGAVGNGLLENTDRKNQLKVLSL